jgi:hypothetical protein
LFYCNVARYGSNAFVSVFPNNICETKFFTTLPSFNLAPCENNVDDTFQSFSDNHKKATVVKELRLDKNDQRKDNELKQVSSNDETAGMVLHRTTEVSPKVMEDIETSLNNKALDATLDSSSGICEPSPTIIIKDTMTPVDNEFSDGDFQRAVVKKSEKKKSKKRKVLLKD